MSTAYQIAQQQAQRQQQIQTIQQENQRFATAYSNKEITLAQFNQAMAFQAQRLKALGYTSQPPAPVNAPPVGLTNQLVTAGAAKQMAENPVMKTFSGKELSPFQKTNAQLASPLTAPISNLPVKERQNALKVAGIGVAVAVAPEVVLPSIAIGEGANVVVSSALATVPVTTKVSGPGGSWEKTENVWSPHLVIPSPQQILDVGLESAAFGLVGGGVMKGVSQAGKVGAVIAGKQVAQSTGQAAEAAITRIGINAGIGAAGGAVLSGGDVKAIEQGAAFGAVMGLGGEAIHAAAGTRTGQRISESLTNLKERIVGVKASELTGAKEVFSEIRNDGETDIIRVTQPKTETVRISKADAEFYRGVTDRTVDLAGTETLKTIKPDFDERLVEVTRFEQPIESTRNAEPMISAVKGEELKMLRETLTEKTMLKTAQGNIGTAETAGKDSGIVLLTKSIEDDAFSLPKVTSANRDFTGVQMKGKVSEELVAKFEKNLQPPEPKGFSLKDIENMKELGGPMKPLRGSIGEVPSGTKIEEQFQASQAKVKQGINLKEYEKITKTSGPMENFADKATGKYIDPKASLKAILEEPKTNVKTNSAKIVSLPKAIVDVQATKPLTLPKGSFAGANAALKFTKPKPSSKIDIQSTVFTPTTNLNQNLREQTQPSLILDTNIKSLTKTTETNLKPIFTVNQETKKMPKVNITPIQKQPQIIVPKQTQPQIPKQKQPIITVPRPTTTTIPRFKTPTFSPPKNKFFPSFGIGGGFDNVAGRRGFGGQWFLKKHKIKTYSQMLQTFGVGQAGKPMRSIEKATNKLLKGNKQPKKRRQKRRR